MCSLAGVTASIFLLSLIHVKAETTLEIEQRLLDDILSTTKYDRRIRPLGKNNSGPVIVRTSAYIRSISDIDDTKMEYSVQLNMRQMWNDNRLKYSSTKPYIYFLTLTNAEKIWRPVIFFSNEKEAHFHDITTPSTVTRIFPNGDIVYSQRLSLKLACLIDLRNYPMDRQTCNIKIRSYSYSTVDMDLLWKEMNPVEFTKNKNLLRFSLDNFKTDYCIDKTGTGEYPCLHIMLIFVRNLNYYFLRVYIPSTMIVLLSWIPFWLGQAEIIARFSFGGIMLLTLIVIICAFNMNAPIVPYPTAADMYFGPCLTFLFSALIECTLIAKAIANENNERNIENNSVDNSLAKKCLLSHDDDDSMKPGKLSNRFPIGYIKRWLKKYSSHGQKIDVISRFLFPFAYVLFNIVYWSYYAPNRLQ